jgi:hypothetical protein
VPLRSPSRREARFVVTSWEGDPCHAVRCLSRSSVAHSGRAVKAYRDQLPALTGARQLYNSSFQRLALTPRGAIGHRKSRSRLGQIPQTTVFYLEHGQHQQPGYTQSNSMCVPSEALYHLADIARCLDLIPLSKLTKTVLFYSSSSHAVLTSCHGASLIFPLILYSYRHISFLLFS